MFFCFLPTSNLPLHYAGDLGDLICVATRGSTAFFLRSLSQTTSRVSFGLRSIHRLILTTIKPHHNTYGNIQICLLSCCQSGHLFNHTHTHTHVTDLLIQSLPVCTATRFTTCPYLYLGQRPVGYVWSIVAHVNKPGLLVKPHTTSCKIPHKQTNSPSTFLKLWPLDIPGPTMGLQAFRCSKSSSIIAASNIPSLDNALEALVVSG